MNKENKIYVIVSHTNSILSRIIKLYTKDEFTHVSASLDKELNHMYSFGRYCPYLYFWGGFIKEHPTTGVFKLQKKTKSRILEIPVDQNQYEKITNIITKFNENKKAYKFNNIGLFLRPLNKDLKRENKFYCSEFVKYLFDESNIYHNIPELSKPEHFSDLENAKIIYEGLLREYLNEN